MWARVVDVDTSAEYGDSPTTGKERSFVCGAVNSTGEATHDRRAGACACGGDCSCDSEAVAAGLACADDCDCGRCGGEHLSAGVEHGWWVVQLQQARWIFVIAATDHPCAAALR